MHGYSQGRRVQVFFGETDQVGHTPRYQALLQYLRNEGAAGATVDRGVAGFGANSRIHTSAILSLSLDLPMILTWIDAPGRVDRLLPGLLALTGSGVVVVEDVQIAGYGGRQLQQLRFDLPVQDVMTRPVSSITADQSAREAAERLVGQQYRALPVVDSDGTLVGVVSSTDLVNNAKLGATIDLLSAMPSTTRAVFFDSMDKRLVSEVMTPRPISVTTTDSVAAATHLMAEKRIKRVPVVDVDGKLCGIVSRADILRAVGETFPRDPHVDAEHPGATTVGEIMRADVPSVTTDADISSVLDAVVSTRLNRAVVLEPDGRVRGVVSDADILRSVDPGARAGVVNALMRSAGQVPEGSKQAGELVVRAPITIAPETTIAEAARLTLQTAVKVICVIDEDRKLVGILDRADLLRAAGDALSSLAAQEEKALGDED